MRTHKTSAGRLSLVAAIAACLTLGVTSSASAQSGGTGTTTSTPAPTTPTTPTAPTTPVTWRTVPGTRAKLNKKGKAIPPAEAPVAVQQAIIAANKIRTYPYRYGGGHQNVYDTGYDCSGAVSYLLYHAGLLTSPMPSGSFMTGWGEPGKGQWITTFAHKSHMYAVVAGLRWDTSSFGERGRSSGKGPRWRRTKRKPTGFVAAHYPGF